ncbi:hypothetical protein [Nocardioides marmorisolisilvae]|uniref:Uncharacterized protein n=1 Tax=Nocardioides marmorisolisilvae TaxID=1542737 RepID=A0A3N0DRP8_9ACTN|nr:hypothetical protein [Nocardioides marmorisolisilvae]RNL78309.1 hypothetical protein EFL95_04155 [Nocardioides marmorisolisilvae]
MGKAIKLPKTECCVSKSRCDRCPIRMLKEGTLPTGYGVHKRELVRVDACGKPLSKKAAKKSGVKSGKVKKAELVAVMRKQKKSGKKAA